MKYLSVCSGIEAASVAWHPLGWAPIAFSEIEKFPCAVLAHHYPTVPNLGDMTTMDVEPLDDIDILVGGTPCQAFSVAGLRQSLDDARGNLTLSYVRLVHELVEQHRLRNIVYENVPGILSTKDNAFGCFLGALVGSDEALVPSPKPADGKSDAHWKWSKGRHNLKWPNAGMVAGPKGRAAWRILDAQYFGVAQRRRRVFVVADFGDGADPAAVLFEREGVPGNPAPSRESRKDVAPTISARPTGGGGLGTDFDLDGGLVEASVLRGISDYGDGKPALRAKGGDAGGGSEVLITQGYGGGRTSGPVEVAAALAAHGVRQDFEVETFIAQTVAIRGREGGATAELGGDVATALRASQGGGDKPHVLTNLHVDEVAGTMKAVANSGGWSNSVDHAAGGYMIPVSVTGEIAHTLKAEGFDASEDGTGRGNPIVAFQSSQSGVRISDVHATLDSNNGPRRHNGALYGSAVRRLTPVECERLQGFPDNYTKINDKTADGPRYKALGNSMAVPVMHWIGARIDRLMPARVEEKKPVAVARFNFGALV